MSDRNQVPIVILDFGSQYTQLIARRVRELGVYCRIYPHDIDIAYLCDLSPQGIILSGSHHSTHDGAKLNAELLTLSIPILGICYGMQVLMAHLGGAVSSCEQAEYGASTIQCLDHPLFARIDKIQAVWMSHGDEVKQLPAGFQSIARSTNADIAAIANDERRCYGLQFHPEVTHTPQGKVILANFCQKICQAPVDWTKQDIINESITDIKQQVGDEQVILGVSGGVDSSVVAALLQKAIGNQLHCVFVDNGLLRLDEVQQVKQAFEQHIGARLSVIDAGEQFLSRLAGVGDPEQKRKIIGNVFVEIFENFAKSVPNAKWLAQGTIYPDVIESAGAKTGKATVIKSHHNVGGLPERMGLKLLEPLNDLFKDEVRTIGRELGLPSLLIDRHPFPGPGLGVRILGEIKQEYVTVLQQADKIFIDALLEYDYYHKVSQAFCVFLPVKSVGVTGDQRRYAYVVSLRAVETTDFMTAHAARLPHELIESVATKIMNNIPQVARVTYDISSKPPSTIEWE